MKTEDFRYRWKKTGKMEMNDTSDLDNTSIKIPRQKRTLESYRNEITTKYFETFT